MKESQVTLDQTKYVTQQEESRRGEDGLLEEGGGGGVGANQLQGLLKGDTGTVTPDSCRSLYLRERK